MHCCGGCSNYVKKDRSVMQHYSVTMFIVETKVAFVSINILLSLHMLPAKMVNDISYRTVEALVNFLHSLILTLFYITKRWDNCQQIAGGFNCISYYPPLVCIAPKSVYHLFTISPVVSTYWPDGSEGLFTTATYQFSSQHRATQSHDFV